LRPAAIEIHDGQQVLLVTGVEVDRLPETAWQQLVDLDIPQSPGRLRWDPYGQRWRVQKVFKPKG
jgi:hypothetical protein